MPTVPVTKLARSSAAVFAFALAATVSSHASIRCATAANPADLSRELSRFDILPCVEAPHRDRSIEKSSAAAVQQAGMLIAWIAAKTDWAAHETPPIRLVRAAELKQMFAEEESTGLNIEAFYSEKNHTVYLPNTWQPGDLRDRSVLLHELVHHLQYLNRIKVTCASEYELQAFKLQADWLSEQGIEDSADFLGIDPFFLMMLGRCDEMSF